MTHVAICWGHIPSPSPRPLTPEPGSQRLPCSATSGVLMEVKILSTAGQ